MHDQPSQSELVDAVRRFIAESAAPQLSGHTAFHARVAANVLDILARELESRNRNEGDEYKRLTALLGASGDGRSLDSLNRELCEKISSGELDLSTDGLMAHLKSTAIAQLKVDQPKYSGLKEALRE
ncbi:MAG: DUF6285 domain-containing protein [Pseudomonadota bacterium]